MDTEEMVAPKFVIATRQKADILYGSTEDFPAGATVDQGVRRVSGYGRIGILGISAEAFSILVEESCSSDGPFTQTGLFASALDATTGLQFVCELLFPCGEYMRVTVTNLGLTADLDLCVHGLPHGSGGP